MSDQGSDATASAPTPTGPRAPKGTTRRSGSSQIDKRTIWLSALVLVGALVLGVGLVALTYDPASTPTTTTIAGETVGAEAPNIVPKPNSGTAPDDAGDPGGWAQLGLLVLLVAVLVGIGFAMMRSRSASARAGREAWNAAAATGRDGAVDELTGPRP